MSHLNNYIAPTGVDLEQRADVQPALNSHVFAEVLSAPNLKRAWKQVRSNKGAVGVDGVRIDDFLDWSKSHWKQCVSQLIDGRYRPHPVRRVEIDKPDGGKRLLGICLLDMLMPKLLSFCWLAHSTQLCSSISPVFPKQAS